MLRQPATALLALVLTSACHDTTEQLVCVPVGPAVGMTVRDSVTNAPAATDARGAVEHSGETDSLMVVAPAQMISHRYASPGSYAVRIEKAGYAPWSTTLVAPTGGRCGPPGVRAEARLQPVAQP